ncbi:MAG: hypothetical protein WAN35_11255 [Terracidiphilus sp.]
MAALRAAEYSGAQQERGGEHSPDSLLASLLHFSHTFSVFHPHLKHFSYFCRGDLNLTQA